MENDLQSFLRQAQAVLLRLEPLLPVLSESIDWHEVRAARWCKQGARGYLQALNASCDVRLSDVLGVDAQREQLQRNTLQFVRGWPANHALLWGARGTGKSSLVRALLAQYAQDGLRLVEVARDDLLDLPQVVEQLALLPQRFIVFCDDLSFAAGEEGYRALKTVLDGSIERAPENVLLYATSNRRHLLPEKQQDNDATGEIHPQEAVEEQIALSDRFGLSLSFYAFSQEHYLMVVRHWLDVLAESFGLNWQWSEELAKLAISWAQHRGNRNGRCAYQFARYWIGLQLLEHKHV